MGFLSDWEDYALSFMKAHIGQSVDWKTTVTGLDASPKPDPGSHILHIPTSRLPPPG